ncbi:alpha/beta fold hydrolase [Thiomonas sp.]
MNTKALEGIHKLKDGRIISFGDYGKKDSVTLFQFHGTPGARIAGLNQNEVEESKFRVLTPERPGYGYSTPHPGATFENWAADIQDLADHLGIRQFHILGVSGGGPFALACAAYIPERVLSVTLISTATPAESEAFWQGMGWVNKIIFIVAIKMPIVLTGICFVYGHLVQWKAARSGLESGYVSEPFRQGCVGLETDLHLVANPWGIPLQTIRVPVYLWHGENDVHSPVAGAKALAAAIPTCEAHFFPEKDHFLHSDAQINQRIENRIRSITMANTAFERDAPKAARPSI